MTLIRYPILPVLGAATLAVALGWGLTTNQQLSFVALVVVVGLMASTAPASAWVSAALVAALTFKGFVSLGVLPSVATFIDLPLAWGALFVALLKQQRALPLAAEAPAVACCPRIRRLVRLGLEPFRGPPTSGLLHAARRAVRDRRCFAG